MRFFILLCVSLYSTTLKANSDSEDEYKNFAQRIQNPIENNAKLVGVQLGFLEETISKLHIKLFDNDYTLSREMPTIKLDVDFPFNQKIKMPYNLDKVNGLLETGILQNIRMNKKILAEKKYLLLINVNGHNNYHTFTFEFLDQ